MPTDSNKSSPALWMKIQLTTTAMIRPMDAMAPKVPNALRFFLVV